MAMYNKFITFLLLTFIVSISFAQQYTPMTAAGYQYKRAKVDSTLHIPSFCGVPTLRNSTAIQGAIAMDTCANKLYQWTHAAGWSIISGAGGGGGGTLQSVTDSGNTTTNDIQLLNHARVILGDSGEVLLDNGSKLRMGAIDAQTGGSKGIAQVCAVGYELKWEGGSLYIMNDQGLTVREVRYKFSSIPTTTDDGSKGFYPGSRWVLDNGQLYVCSDSTSGAAVWQDATYPSLQDVATVGNYYANDNADTLRLNSYDAVLNIKHPILWTNDQYGGTPNNILDFSYGPSWYENVANIKFGNNSNSLGEGYIEITDKQSYFKNEMSQRTIIQNAPSTYATIQTTYFPLMKGSIDTLATTEDIRNSAIDTANKWVNDVLKKNDSTITIYKGATATDITLTPSTTVASATRLTTIVFNNSGATITKGSVIYINGRHSSNLPTIALAKANSEDSSYATFALVQDDILNNNSGTIIQAGNISNLNLPIASFADGQVVYLSPTVAGGLTVDKTSVLAPNHIIKIGTITRAHPTFGSIEIRIENGWQMDELSDVQIPLYPNDSTLLQYSRVDSLWHSVGITNAIGSNYIKPSDTASLSSRIDLRVKYTDTATMLTPYLRSNIASATYLAKSDTASLSNRINLKVNISDTASMLSPYARTNIVNANLANKVNISDTATMLTPYLRSNTAAATYLAKSDSTTYYTKYRSDTSRTNIYNALNGKQGTLTLTTTGTSGASTLVGNTLNIPQYSGGTSYTFSTGLTNTANTITNNLSTGISGGQSVVGGTAASNSLTLSSTSNATKGKILFGTSAYNEVNNRLGIGTASPASFIDGVSTATSGAAYSLKHTQTALNASDANDACLKLDYTISGSGAGTELVTRALFLYTNNNWITGNVSNMRVFNLASQTVASSNTTNLDQVYIESSTGGTVTNFRAIHIANSQGTSQGGLVMNQLTGTNRAGVSIGSSILPSGVWSIYSSTSDKSYHAGNFLLNTTTDAGYKLDVNGTARVQGAVNYNPTNTPAGTTGNQTINKPSGTVNIAAAGTTVTVTNNLVTTSSIVFAVIRTNDGTATIKNVVPAAGSFTINLAAAATAEVSIGFFVIN